MLFYCAQYTSCFHSDYETVVAESAMNAAEIVAGRWLDSLDADHHRPMEVVVAEDDAGSNAVRFKVKRTIIVRDEVTECGPVVIPPPEEDE